MSVVDAPADDETVDHSSDGGKSESSVPAPPRQATWFGIAADDAEHAGGPFVGVVFNRPIEQVLDLSRARPAQASHPAGQRVRVPLGRGDRPAVGYCVRVDRDPPADLDPHKIKTIVEVLDPLPLIDGKMLELTRWMADYYACSWGQALDAAVPAGVKKHAGTRVGNFLIVPAEIKADWQAEALKRRLTPKQTAALEVLCAERRAADGRRRLPPGQVHDRADPRAAKTRSGAHGPPPLAGRALESDQPTAGCGRRRSDRSGGGAVAARP